MEALIQFSIPIKGIKSGIHHYSFQIEPEFFENFEHSPIQEAHIKCDLELEKRPDLIHLSFSLEGRVKTECDRCLAPIHLPVESKQYLLAKYSAEEMEDDGEIIYIHLEAQKLNVAKYIYEYICLSLPLVKIYDCEQEDPPVCNFEMLKFLETDPQEEKEESGDPVWDELKKLKSK